jgi:glycosyltransferase involved in cell wall biosynthesis
MGTTSIPSRFRGPLAVIETHPIQYRAPVYRALQQQYGVPVTAIFGSDFSVAGYYDAEFKSQFAWDTDLLSGYSHVFLSRVAEGGAANYDSVSARGLDRAIRAVNPAAILLPGYSPRFLQIAWFHALRSGKPLLFRGETADRPQSSGSLKLRLRDQVLRWLYAKCDRLLYIGQRSEDHYLRYGCPPEKLIFSPYCVDPAPFQTSEAERSALRAAARAELQVGDSAKVLLFSGKISHRKGPDLLVEAVRQMTPAERQDVVVVFLGSGEMTPEIAAAAARDPKVDVRFPGFRNQKQLSPYFHAADLFVLPSRRLETWGLVVNEALLHGLPCVVSDAVGCGPDLVAPAITGEVFNAGSATELAVALRRGFSLAGRREVRDACRNRVAGYSIARAAEGIAKAYSDVVS